MTKKVSQLEKRAAQLAAQLQAAEARLKEEKRRSDARRKILWGAALLSAFESETDKEKMNRLELYLLRFMSEKDRNFLESFK